MVAPEDRAVYDALNKPYKGMGSTEMPLFIKRKKIEFGVPSRIVDGRTLVLLRKLAKSLVARWSRTRLTGR
ncbi:MAG: hypothetical protein AB1330_11490 [Bacillota bacterium]